MKARENTRKLVECALLIAIGTVLGILKLVELPYGGSVTLASMLPVVLISYRHGLCWGMGSGLAFALVQQLCGLGNLSYVTTWQSVLAVIFLDYIFAFACCGLGGIFRRSLRTQSVALAVGSLFVCVIRYACHVISGATVWAGISIPTAAALGYSLIYNATYMVPETVVLVLVAYYIGSVLDLTREIPVRMQREGGSRKADALLAVAALVGVAALVVDVALIFSHMQDPESGVFSLQLLAVERFLGSFWMGAAITSGVAVLAVAVLLVVRRRLLAVDGEPARQ